MNKNKSNSRMLKSGSYSAVITVCVIAFIVVINMIVSALPASYTKFDFTEQQMYTLSEQTKGIVKGLQEEVTVYVWAQKENEDPKLMNLLDKYKGLSSKLKIEIVDPALNPAFKSAYTEETLSENSIIVVSDQRNRVVDALDMYDNLSYDETTGEVLLTSESNFLGEDAITSAIDYVTMENMSKMYVSVGHNETSIYNESVGNLAQEIIGENIDTEILNMTEKGQVPEDAEALMMVAPLEDISDAEKTILQDYLAKGGKFFYISSYEQKDTPNLDAVLKEYGIKISSGVICDEVNYFDNNPFNVRPTYGSHMIVEPLSVNQMQMKIAAPQSIQVLNHISEDIVITPLLRTSSTTRMTEVGIDESGKPVIVSQGDKEGVQNLAVIVEKYNTQIIVATTPDLVYNNTNVEVAGANYDFVLNCIGYLCDHEDSISIRGKQLYSDSLVVTSGHTMIWIFVLMIVLPIACLVTGLVLWVRRRKR